MAAAAPRHAGAARSLPRPHLERKQGHPDRLLGISRAEVPTTGDGWLEFVHPDDAADLSAAFDEAVEPGSSLLTEYRMLHSDGDSVVVQDTGLVLGDDDGRRRVVVGALRDVTAERDAQRALEEHATALRVLLDQRRRDRTDLERNVTDNLRELVLPTLDRLARSLHARPEAAQLAALRTTLEEIVAPLVGPDAAAGRNGERLTRRELEIVQLIRAGRTTDEIAESLHLGRATVTYHRQNVRRKLGLGPRSPHLSAYLSARPAREDECDDPLARLLGGREKTAATARRAATP